MTGHRIDAVLDKLSVLSTQAIQSMDNNIALMGNIINLHEQLGRTKDESVFNNIITQSEFYSDQMHLINLRTKYFEAQLNILAAHTTFNSLLRESSSDQVIPKNDDDINWKTTEATLENLYLEYHYHTIKFQELLNSSNRSEAVSTPKKEKEQESTMTLNKKESRALLLKPLRTSAKRNSRLLESPQPTTPSNFNDSSMTLQEEEGEELPKKNLYNVLEETKFTHKRSSSMPETPRSQIIDVFEEFLPNEEENNKNVRHFISYDTGLNEYVQNNIPVNFDNSSIIKETEIFGSFDDHSFEDDFTFNEFDDKVLEPTLKRSTSHDSLFEPRNRNPNTIWMDKLNHSLQQPTVETFNVTADTIILEPSPQLHDTTFFQNFNDFLAPAPPVKQKISNAKTSKQLLNAVVTNNYVKKLQDGTQPIPIPTHEDNTMKSQWSSFLSNFNPPKIKIPPSSVVTSEIGKPLSIPITTTKKLSSSDSQIKGSYSTLTIGPNHSRTINYGRECDLNVGNVLSSKISHAALNDALNDSAFY